MPYAFQIFHYGELRNGIYVDATFGRCIQCPVVLCSATTSFKTQNYPRAHRLQLRSSILWDEFHMNRAQLRNDSLFPMPLQLSKRGRTQAPIVASMYLLNRISHSKTKAWSPKRFYCVHIRGRALLQTYFENIVEASPYR